MGYAVYHTEKGSTSSGSLGNHIDRNPEHEFSYRHADPDRAHLNQDILNNESSKMPLAKAVEKRIEEGYAGTKKIRSDAVKYCTHVFTGTHEDMKKIFENHKTAQKWIDQNTEFLKKEFGKENIVRFALHMDERTPHIHAVTVPLTADGRLSAKEMIGNRAKMQGKQDKYAAMMQEFGLQRGKKSTGIKHESAREYYARMEAANKTDFKRTKGIFGGYTAKTAERMEDILESQKTALKSLKMDFEKKSEQLGASSKKNKYYLEKYEKMEKQFIEQNKGIKAILENPSIYEKNRKIYEEKQAQKKESQEQSKKFNQDRNQDRKRGMRM